MGIELLLLEDDPAKKSKLLSFINVNRELFSRVDSALCTSEARDRMKERRYDLFLVDIVVPAFLGGEKSEQHSISLFHDIEEGYDGVLRPRYCLPISSCSDLSQDAHDFFVGRPWGILPYHENDDDCLLTIEKVVRFVIGENQNTTHSKHCEVLLITALMEPEYVAIEGLHMGWGPLEPLDSSQLIRFGEFRAYGRDITVGAAFAARMGPVSSAILTTKAILNLKPKLIIMAGICAGIPSKAQIGDVIAADVSWDWQSGKYVNSDGVETFEIAPHQCDIDENSRNQLLLLKRDTEFWESLSPMALSAGAGHRPKLVIGPVATGASVLSDARVVDRIRKTQNKNVVGLDMETYGVFAAAAACSPHVRVLSLKAVCDKGDERKSDQFQQYASQVSARSIHHFLSTFCEPLLLGNNV